MTILRFAPEAFPFHDVIADALGGVDLARLSSDVVPAAGEEAFSIYKQMERAAPYRRLYAALEGPAGEAFYALYERFIREEIRPQYDGPILYQRRPTHRLHFHDGAGAARFHKDSDYGHSETEINYSVPQTPAHGTNAIWIESAPDRADYRPIELTLGEYVRFPGATHRHGTRENDTGATRVSFDFRVIPEDRAPERLTDTSRWRDEDHANPLFRNAHAFGRCA